MDVRTELGQGGAGAGRRGENEGILAKGIA